MSRFAKLVLAIFGFFILAGCSSTKSLTLMPRDSGKTYAGSMVTTGNGVGTVSIVIDQVTYSGPIVKVGSNETFGFATAYGYNNRRATANSFGTSFSDGDQFGKAILSSTNGKGLRCDLSGRYSSGGGICVDDEKHVYDVIFVAQ